MAELKMYVSLSVWQRVYDLSVVHHVSLLVLCLTPGSVSSSWFCASLLVLCLAPGSVSSSWFCTVGTHN